MHLRRKKPHPHPPPHPDYITRSEFAKATNQTRSLEQSDVQGLAARVAHLEADVTGLLQQLAAHDARIAVLEMLIS